MLNLTRRSHRIHDGLRYFFALTLFLCASTQVAAQNIAADVGASERINVAGQLGTLSQRIISSACNVHSGVTVRESQAVLQISADQFDRIGDALLYGNRRLGILGEETRPRTLQTINKLNEAWVPLLDQARQIQVSGNDASVVATLASQSDPLLETANILVSEITGQYADPVSLLHADALLIDLSGRQRMLAAQMSKDMCLIAAGINVDTAKADLAEASALFGDTLTALRNGLPSVGVRPPPTERIAEGLQFVVEEWAAIQPFIAQAQAGEVISAADRQRVYFAFLGIEARMNNVAVAYDRNSKLGL
ncbi:type IV pili methyl-accepting chemotaxis transducer N-terminal domain-containing protein [Cognatiyoonia sp. IB215182]|uniref:type IV pili methyl-accepting chemotaxis transducer N-terminal domain-containing protein n=1 Tax=Cognatiyoonia sp. IB215182 TaxID=3097353 RepID=UPI002A0CA835|nr:type IV pili methyl-accepting chemotaxis transducer N-terminal domain-containing protein [Cognatiyoonia sp. IB215182]MDX8355079.1 type IV pili methyl-accepting chemotaxis transducer N-terminal domain-containing protein [Cognatiyoonia sp. IB215182]